MTEQQNPSHPFLFGMEKPTWDDVARQKELDETKKFGKKNPLHTFYTKYKYIHGVSSTDKVSND